jgi:hypothetical protein
MLRTWFYFNKYVLECEELPYREQKVDCTESAWKCQRYVKTYFSFRKDFFYVNCWHFQSQMRRFGREFIWNTRNGEKQVIQGESELDGGARNVRRQSAPFVKLCVRSLKRLIYELWMRRFSMNFLEIFEFSFFIIVYASKDLIMLCQFSQRYFSSNNAVYLSEKGEWIYRMSDTC